MSVVIYAVYRTTASGNEPVGYVTNNIMWDGVSNWAPGAGFAVVADPDRLYPIGSIYAPAATSATKTG